jgi:hypothetical protein
MEYDAEGKSVAFVELDDEGRPVSIVKRDDEGRLVVMEPPDEPAAGEPAPPKHRRATRTPD